MVERVKLGRRRSVLNFQKFNFQRQLFKILRVFGSVFVKHAVPNQAAPILGADFFIFSKRLYGFDNRGMKNR